jgi:hypothetical protein
MAEPTSQTNALSALYRRLHAAALQLFQDETEFKTWVDQSYGLKSRVFHGPHHLLYMTNQSSQWAEQSCQQLADAVQTAYERPVTKEERLQLHAINLIAGAWHDTEYHVDGKWTEDGKRFLSSYVVINNHEMPIALKSLLPSRGEDRVLHLILDVFDLKAGDTLSPTNGQNEFLSALAMAKRAETAGVDEEVIVGAAASIAATVPFKQQKDFARLQEQLDHIYQTDPVLAKNYPDPTEKKRRVDLLTGAATLLANQDVLEFLGGIEPHQSPTPDSVSLTFRGGDWLQFETSPSLRSASAPGVGYSAYDMLSAAFKLVRFYERVIPSDRNNIFHGISMRGAHDVAFPPEDIVRKMNAAVRAEDGKSGNGDIVSLAQKSHTDALALVHAIALQSKIQNIDLARQVGGVFERNLTLRKRLDISPQERLAITALKHRHHGFIGDIESAPIASALLESVDATAIHNLYQAAEKYFGSKPGDETTGTAFLKEASTIIGRDKITSIAACMENARRAAGDHVSAGALAGFTQAFAAR